MLKLKQFKTFGFPDGGTHVGNKDRARHLAALKRIRDGVDPEPNKLGSNGGFAGVELSIPELDYYVLQHRFPDLKSPDHEIRTRAWLKFSNSPEAEPYRVTRKKRGPLCRSITAR